MSRARSASLDSGESRGNLLGALSREFLLPLPGGAVRFEGFGTFESTRVPPTGRVSPVPRVLPVLADPFGVGPLPVGRGKA